VDPVLQWVSDATANMEISLNIVVMVALLAPGIAVAVVRDEQVCPFLIASIALNVIFWYLTEAPGMILTGIAGRCSSTGLLSCIRSENSSVGAVWALGALSP